LVDGIIDKDKRIMEIMGEIKGVGSVTKMGKRVLELEI
jgi:hypothetical protein